MRADDLVLALNAGSSSLKAAVFEGEHRILRCVVEALGAGARVRAQGAGGDMLPGPAIPPSAGNASDALPALLAWVREQLGPREISAAGHRVVHGGLRHAGPARVTPALLAELEALVPLAPLHQPHNLAPIRRLREDMPRLPQVACFDTAFHRTIPETEQAFALPRAMFDGGIRRYGFHGLSYDHIASRLRVLSPRLAEGRTVVAHLGAGASACALRAGVSVATTMGFTALDGLPMATRCGALDAGVVLHLLRQQGLSPTEVEDLLYRRSGVLGLSGGISADFRDLLASTDPRAGFALDVFIGRVAQQVAALAVAMGGLDGLVFTAGIGEHAALVRARIVETLGWLGLVLDGEANARHHPRVSAARSKVEVLVVPTDEELVVARQVRAVLGDVPNRTAHV
jgi:acetate kinase